MKRERELTLSRRSDPHREETAHVDSAAASSSAMSAVCAYTPRNLRVCRKSYMHQKRFDCGTSANSRLVLHDLRSIADPIVCNAASSGL